MNRPGFLALFMTVLIGGEPTTLPSSEMPANSTISRVFLGVILEDGNTFDGPAHVRVTRVVAGSTSERIGLLADDRIISMNGQPGNTIAAFRSATAALQHGDTITLEVVREGKPRTLSGVVEAPPRPKDVLVDAARITADIAQVRELVDRARLRGDLETTLRLLREFEAGLPAVAAEYKRLYPKGTFDIQIHINIRSDPAASEQTSLQPAVTQPTDTLKP